MDINTYDIDHNPKLAWYMLKVRTATEMMQTLHRIVNLYDCLCISTATLDKYVKCLTLEEQFLDQLIETNNDHDQSKKDNSDQIINLTIEAFNQNINPN